jgi:hypothetical protein
MKKIPFKTCKAPDCSNQFQPYKSTQKVCGLQCAIVLASEISQKKQLTEARRAKKKYYDDNMTIQKLTIKVQREHFNPFIRSRDEGKKCVSCDKILSGKFDAGHYHNSQKSAVRFDEANVHGQCVQCNQWMHGNLIPYGKELLKRIGPDEMARLDSIAHVARHWTREELKELMEKYPKPKKSEKK